MKKISFIALFLMLATGLFAKTGVGAAFSYGLDTGAGGAALNISHKAIPGTIFGITANISNGNTAIGIYDDWWLYQSNLAGAIDLYLGPGLFVNFNASEGQDQVDINAGFRLPIGLRLFPITPLELFIEVAPTLTPITNSGVSISGSSIGAQGALGIRFWF